jgi:hypothetical protein
LTYLSSKLLIITRQLFPINTISTAAIMADLIVAFPHQRNRLVVRFADTVQRYTIERHEDNNVARHELWYTKAEYHSMKLAIKEDVLQVHAQAMAGVPFNYAGDDDASAVESSVCCIGIEHLLTANVILEVKACRARCIRAVLAEQARQGPSTRFGWEAIALASYAQSKKSVLKARRLGKLHEEAV